MIRQEKEDGADGMTWEGFLPRQFLAERRRVAGERKASFEVDEAVLNQLRNLTIEMLHSVGGAGLHGIQKILILALAFFDALASAGVGFENLEGSHAPAAIGLRHQPLADDVAE